MTDTTKDLIKSDPIGVLDKASKVNLIGGGAMLVVAVAGAYKNNVDGWQVSNGLLLALVIVAGALAVVGAVLRGYDAHLRTKLAMRLLDVKGTTDGQKADLSTPVEVASDLVKNGAIAFLVAPNSGDTSKSGD